MFTSRGEFRWLYVIAGINVLMFLVFSLLGSKTPADEVLIYGIFNSYLVEKGMFWLLITSNFLHFSLTHFLLNFIALLQIGVLVEKVYTSKKLFIVYMFGGLVSSLFTLLLANLQNEVISSLGASGSIFALLGLLVGGTLKHNRFGYDLPFKKEDFYPTLLLALIISFLPNINWAAHLGGFIIGIIFGFIFQNSLTPGIDSRDKRIERYLLIISVLMLVFSYALLVANLFFEIVKIQ